MLQTLADHCGGALERLRIEDALRESQAQLQRAESVALVMTAHVELDGRWLKVPPTLCDLLGYDERELIGASTSTPSPTPTTWRPIAPSGGGSSRARASPTI